MNTISGPTAISTTTKNSATCRSDYPCGSAQGPLSSVVGRARIVADVKVAVNRADQGVDKHLADRARRWQRAGGHASGVRQELAAGVVQWTPKTEVEATSILPSLNGKTARSWRGIVPFTHLAREGAYDSHYRTAGIAGCTRQRGGGVAASGARAGAGQAAEDRLPGLGLGFELEPMDHRIRSAAE